MIRARITFLYDRGFGKDQIASRVVKEESMTSGDIAVSQRTLPSPKHSRCRRAVDLDTPDDIRGPSTFVSEAKYDGFAATNTI